MDKKSNALAGSWPLFGTYVLLLVAALELGGFSTAVPDLISLAHGNVHNITKGFTGFLFMFPVMFAVLVIELPCCIGASIFQNCLLGKKIGKHSVSELFDFKGERSLFVSLFLIVLAEELFARWFFLGLLPKLPFLSGPFAFYAFFLIGNALWALVHLNNFQDPNDRHWLRVLPQFVSGFFFTYVFVKYGLLAAVLTHFAANALLFSMHRVQNVNWVDGSIVAYSLVCMAVSYWLMEKPLTDLAPWFNEKPTFHLVGWEFWDYAKVDVFLTASFSAVFGLLLYDRSTSKSSTTTDPGPIGYFIVVCVMIWVMYGLYWFLGLFFASVPYRILVLGILFVFLEKSPSASAMSRSFWSSLPSLYVSMCVLNALGFWLSVAFVGVNVVVLSPLMFLRKLDD